MRFEKRYTVFIGHLKTLTYKQANPIQQIIFIVFLLTIILLYPMDNILFMDKTGFYQSQTYTRSWSVVGEPYYDKTNDNKGKC